LLLDGKDLRDADERGEPLADSVFLLLLNAYHEAIAFMLPASRSQGAWHLRVDTSRGWVAASGPSPEVSAPLAPYSLTARALAVFEWVGNGAYVGM
jgi:glycogen operon protein